ncbi:MAG: hypothetical protein AB8C84_01290 [Oligoflexales bacterium]
MILRLAIYTLSMIMVVATAGVGFLHWMDTSWLWFMTGVVTAPLICTGSALCFHRLWDITPHWAGKAVKALSQVGSNKESHYEVTHAGMQMAYCPVDNRGNHRKKLR